MSLTYSQHTPYIYCRSHRRKFNQGRGSMARRCTPCHEPTCGPGGVVRPSACVAGRPVGPATGRRPWHRIDLGPLRAPNGPDESAGARGATFRERGGARCSRSVVDSRSTADSARCADPPTWRGRIQPVRATQHYLRSPNREWYEGELPDGELRADRRHIGLIQPARRAIDGRKESASRASPAPSARSITPLERSAIPDVSVSAK